MRRSIPGYRLLTLLTFLGLLAMPVWSQERSVRPGINKPYENPNVKEFISKFEIESREVFANRERF
jgi:hypothetical protein